MKFPLSQLAGLLWTDSVSLTAHLQRAGVKLDSSHVWFGAKTVEGEWSTLIGPDPSRYCALIGSRCLRRKDTAKAPKAPYYCPSLGLYGIKLASFSVHAYL